MNNDKNQMMGRININSKSESRSTKQYLMFKYLKLKTFEFVSNFDISTSDLLLNYK